MDGGRPPSLSGNEDSMLKQLWREDQTRLFGPRPTKEPQPFSADVGLAGFSGNAADTRNQHVGWGGQAIPDHGIRVPWFGRGSRGKPNNQRTRGGARTPLKTERLPVDTPSAARFPVSTRDVDESLSVEEAVQVIKNAGSGERIPERIFRALVYFDSRGAALLLKDLGKLGLVHRSDELFDWLRNVNERHPLRHLCDVYTYTAMVTMCNLTQKVERAMELVQEMRDRQIELNVHTYTALMNVCIKCGKLNLALEVYGTMRSQNCIPNVVTFNTLIDVYGKLGQWERAAKVLTDMRTEGVQPVPRTYNTLIIACNMCNQPKEALAVYEQMVAEGFTPNSTTYNALISAYGKVGQLEKVMQIYQEMLWKGCERSVITYSSLISACEKAGGHSELALKLFDDMQREGCQPNTVTYNSLITACSQGAQWEQASKIFEQMQNQGCTPDVVTYTALISAFERGFQWQRALQAFQQMCVQGCRPDAIVYNAIIDALWETGLCWAQSKALQLFKTAVKQGHFPQQRHNPGQPRLELNLHAMTAGVAMLSLYCWLQDLKQAVISQGEPALPATLWIVTDKGKSSKEQGNFIVKEAVASMMAFWEAPFRMVQESVYGGVLEASGVQVSKWLLTNAFQALMASSFPFSDFAKAGDPLFSADDANFQREYEAQSTCTVAFSHVREFERTHCLILNNMGYNYQQARTPLITELLEYGSKLSLKEETVHDAILLMDRTMSASSTVQDQLLPLLAVGALSVAVGQSEGKLLDSVKLQEVTDVPPDAIGKMEWNIRLVLQDDTSAISSMRCLKVYLQRLGYQHLDKPTGYGMGGLALLLNCESLFDLGFLNCRPSVVAAAILYAERRMRGAVPFWPSMLAKLTGYTDMSTPELMLAMRGAQKLCRKAHYCQAYRTNVARNALTRNAPPSLITATGAVFKLDEHVDYSNVVAGSVLPRGCGSPMPGSVWDQSLGLYECGVPFSSAEAWNAAVVAVPPGPLLLGGQAAFLTLSAEEADE